MIARRDAAEGPAALAEPAAPPDRSRRRAWLGDILAAAVVLLGGGLLFGFGVGLGFGGGDAFGNGDAFGGPGRPPLPSGLRPFVALQLLGLGFTAFTAALMFFRRRWPLAVFIAALICFFAAALLGVPGLGPGIAATVAAYALAERVPRRLAFAIVGTAGGATILLSLFEMGRISFDVRIGAALFVAAALGDGARSRREYLAAVEERAERAERTREAEAQRRVSDERLRIARELHDTVAHQLSVINLHAGVASGHMSAHPVRAEEALGTIRSAAREALTEIGDLLRYLRDAGNTGAAPPRQGLDGLDALLGRMRDAGLDISVEVHGNLDRVGGATGSAAYRVVQEALTNAHKHGSGGSAALRLAVEPDDILVRVTNLVADTGIAGDPAPSAWLGLTGIRERVAVLQGTVSAGRSGSEYVLEVHLPIRQAAEEE
ncbi:sensor histidine kinase [Leucobacter soli]|nr:histidine kinase [Leucobacter soli]